MAAEETPRRAPDHRPGPAQFSQECPEMQICAESAHILMVTPRRGLGNGARRQRTPRDRIVTRGAPEGSREGPGCLRVTGVVGEDVPMVRPASWSRPAGGSPVRVGTGAPG